MFNSPFFTLFESIKSFRKKEDGYFIDFNNHITMRIDLGGNIYLFLNFRDEREKELIGYIPNHPKLSAQEWLKEVNQFYAMPERKFGECEDFLWEVHKELQKNKNIKLKKLPYPEHLIIHGQYVSDHFTLYADDEKFKCFITFSGYGEKEDLLKSWLKNLFPDAFKDILLMDITVLKKTTPDMPIRIARSINGALILHYLRSRAILNINKD